MHTELEFENSTSNKQSTVEEYGISMFYVFIAYFIEFGIILTREVFRFVEVVKKLFAETRDAVEQVTFSSSLKDAILKERNDRIAACLENRR